MKFQIFIYAALLLTFSGLSYSQVPSEPENDDNIQQLIESATENIDKELDDTEIFEPLNHLKKNPLDLNNASADELKNIIFLNDLQINNLIAFRQKYGNLKSVYELQAIEGFYLDIIFKILPFIYVSQSPSSNKFDLKKSFSNGNSKFIIKFQQTIEEKKGFSAITDSALNENPNARYLGSPQKIYFRYNYRYFNMLSLGITAIKDPGEEFFAGTQKKGFDFYSAHIFIGNTSYLKSLAIGDYQAQFGQGLTFYSGYSFYGKSSEVININKYAQGIKPYSSSFQNRFLRGMASTLAFGNFEITGLFSSRLVDAVSMPADTFCHVESFSYSPDYSGIHATQSQIENKNNLKEIISGGHIAYKNYRLNIGLTAINAKYDNFISFSSKPYNQFGFQGKTNSIVGADYNYSIYNFNLFGEFASSQNNGKAFLSGLMISPDSRLLLSFLYRYFSRNFHPVMSSAFSENSYNANEEGIYSGLSLKIKNSFTVSAYCDYYKFHWLKYGVDIPSYGKSFLAKINFSPTEFLEIYFLYRYRNKISNMSDDFSPLHNVNNDIYNHYRFNFAYKHSSSLNLRSRAELISHQNPDNKKLYGFIIFQDLIMKEIMSSISITLRYALFDTDSYDERIYAFENNIPYTYSVIPYYYKGSRFYVITHYLISSNLSFWIRFSRSFYPMLKSIGSDLDQINSNHKSEIHCSIKLTF